MIIFLTLLLIMFAPGNTFAFSSLMMFGSGHIARKMDLAGKLFVAWIIWAFICCAWSKYPIIAFFGCPIRMEGWLMWLIIARLGWIYWESFEDFHYLVLFCTIASLLNIGISLFVGHQVIPAGAIAAFSAMALVVVWAHSPLLAILTILPSLLLCNNRAGIVAGFIGVFIYVMMSRNKKTVKDMWTLLGVIVLCAAFLPVGAKIMHFNLHALGSGARVHWIKETCLLATNLPVTGFGLDTLEHYLTNPSTGGFIPNLIPDRTHNLACDILLMTGWIGLSICGVISGRILFYVEHFKSKSNSICVATVIAWVIFSCMNPSGCAANCLMAICLFGLTENIDDNV